MSIQWSRPSVPVLTDIFAVRRRGRPLLFFRGARVRDSGAAGTQMGQVSLETEPGIAFSHSSPMCSRSCESRCDRSISRTIRW
jgi:hypothetical protein